MIVSTVGAIAVVTAGGGVWGWRSRTRWRSSLAESATHFCCGGSTAGLRLLPRGSDRSARRMVLGFSSFTLLADSMMFVGARLDTVVIAALRNAAAAAPFAAANKLQTAIQTLTLPVINLMLPMVAELEARGMRRTVIERLLVATRVTLQVTAPVALGIAFFSADIVDLWLGDTAPAITASIITILAISTLTLCAVPTNRVLIGIGRARTVGWLNAVEGLSEPGDLDRAGLRLWSGGRRDWDADQQQPDRPRSLPGRLPGHGVPAAALPPGWSVAGGRVVAAQRRGDAAGLAADGAEQRPPARRVSGGGVGGRPGRGSPAWPQEGAAELRTGLGGEDRSPRRPPRSCWSRDPPRELHSRRGRPGDRAHHELAGRSDSVRCQRRRSLRW